MTIHRKAVLMLMGLLMALLAVSPTAYARLSGPERDNAVKATVLVLTLDNDRQVIASGSGDLVDERGLLLTNFHVIGDTETGEMYNSDGLVVIAITRNARRPAVPTYFGQVVKGDNEMDLALIRIVADIKGNELKSCQKLPIFKVGDSEALVAGDELALVGFPGIGGQSVTLSFGAVSGFISDPNDEETVLWIKTDAEANHGNSGGAAVNEAGELVGILTAGNQDQDSGGKLGLVRPVELAAPLLDGLSRMGVAGCGRGSNTTMPAPDVGGGLTGEGQLNFLGFSLSDAEDAELVESVPSGTTTLYGNFEYADIAESTPLQAQWSFNGETIEESVLDFKSWPLDPGTGNFYISTESEDVLEDGIYTLEVRAGNLPLLTQSIEVGGDGSGVSSGGTTGEEVTFVGRIISADTGKPIRGAAFLILAPGITLNDFDPENEEHVLDMAQTDRQGNFETTVPVGLDETYSVAILARGFKPIGADDFIPSEFGTASGSVIDLGDIQLKKR